jgi:outer membrane protein assembly factor BamB
VKRVPVFFLAVLVATVLTAAASKWRGADAPLRQAEADARSSAAQSAASRGLGAGPPPSAPSGHSARMLHGDARHTHRGLGRAPAATPVVAWATDVGGPVEAQVTTSPDERVLYVASLAGTLSALGRSDGAVLWSLPLGDRAYATPCVADDGTIYVGSDAKKLFAVAPSGKVKWTLETEGDADSAPVATADGSVIVAGGRMVYGVNPFGQVRWRFAAKRKVFSSPAIAPGGRVIFGAQDHHVYALSSAGGLAWSTDLGADVDGTPAVGEDGGAVVGTDGDEVVRLEMDDGRIAWRSNVGGFVRGALSIARNGDILAGVYGPTPRQVRLRASDGSLVGEFLIPGTGAREFGVHGGALEDDVGTLVFGAQDNDVIAVDASGRLLWRFATGDDVDAPVTMLASGELVFGSDDGKVYLLRSP